MTPEDKVKFTLGDLMLRICILEVENARLHKMVSDFEARASEKEKVNAVD